MNNKIPGMKWNKNVPYRSFYPYKAIYNNQKAEKPDTPEKYFADPK